MTMALATSKLSRNPYTQVGACIVNNNKVIIGLGYNGIPRTLLENQFDWYTGPRDYNLQRYIYGTIYINFSFSFLFLLINQKIINKMLFNR